tara:strand:+ start:733 stop:1014 length:282 start_codon:yes stop_codon:yes gene_type:complete
MSLDIKTDSDILLAYVSDEEQAAIRWFNRRHKAEDYNACLVTYGGEYQVQYEWGNGLLLRFGADTSEVGYGDNLLFVVNSDLPRYVHRRLAEA